MCSLICSNTGFVDDTREINTDSFDPKPNLYFDSDIDIDASIGVIIEIEIFPQESSHIQKKLPNSQFLFYFDVVHSTRSKFT